MRNKPILPILDRARELLDYNPETGVFTWPHGGKGTKGPGSEAGRIKRNVDGTYRCIRIDGEDYYAHRLAWVWIHGAEAPNQVDHEDKNGLNNAASNLRNGDDGVNNLNKINKHNPWGCQGVRVSNPAFPGWKWRAQFKGVDLYTGRDFFEACCARKSAESRYWAAHG